MAMQPSLDKLLKNDNVFNAINGLFVTLQDADVKDNNAYLLRILQYLFEEMKETDELFKLTYQGIKFVGSYYKHTKVGKPEEFDLNIVIKLPPPFNYDQMKFEASQPGFVKIYTGNAAFLSCTTETAKSVRLIQKWIVDENFYINQNKVRRWMESVLTRTMHRLRDSTQLVFRIDNCQVGLRKSGPAFTLLVTKPNKETMSIDLVPILEFKNSLKDYRSKLAQFKKKEWFVVPKPFIVDGIETDDCLWRLSFYQQEQEILSQNGRIKPVIRQMKKLRDKQGWNSICSYYIEMCAMNYVLTLEDLNQTSFTVLLYNLLKELRSACRKHSIAWYWNTNLNLFSKVKPAVLSPIADRLEVIIKNVERRMIDDNLVLAKYILTEDELQTLLYNFPWFLKKSITDDIICKNRDTVLTNTYLAIRGELSTKRSEDERVEMKSVATQTDSEITNSPLCQSARQ